MITLEELSKLVEAEFANDERALKEWKNMKAQMEPHYEPLPCSDWYTDENGNEVQDYEDQLVEGCADTFEDDIAYFCWKCGCYLYTSQDYYDGSPEYGVALPTTEEGYQNNLIEADNFWAEAGWDEYSEDE